MARPAAADPTEHELVKDSTVPRRRAYVAARKEAAAERDATRFRLRDEIAAEAAFEIPRERGFYVAPPGTLDGAAEVVEHANALIDSIGHEGLMSGRVKAGFIAKGFLPPEAYELDSPYLRLALSRQVVGPVAKYLGVLPILQLVDIWYSAHSDRSAEAPVSSQQWHLDGSDTRLIKVWLHCNDIALASGPLTVVPAAQSDELAERLDYNLGDSYRVADDKLEAAIGEGEIVALEGPKESAAFVDTCSCFHFGSRVTSDAPPRRMVLFQYLTPYAFQFRTDHREEARYRELGRTAASEYERLLLGAV